VGFHDEVDFLASVSPIVKLAFAGSRRVGKMSADRSLFLLSVLSRARDHFSRPFGGTDGGTRNFD
jgi:hypothetical protein